MNRANMALQNKCLEMVVTCIELEILKNKVDVLFDYNEYFYKFFFRYQYLKPRHNT